MKRAAKCSKWCELQSLWIIQILNENFTKVLSLGMSVRASAINNHNATLCLCCGVGRSRIFDINWPSEMNREVTFSWTTLDSSRWNCRLAIIWLGHVRRSDSVCETLSSEKVSLYCELSEHYRLHYPIGICSTRETAVDRLLWARLHRLLGLWRRLNVRVGGSLRFQWQFLKSRPRIRQDYGLNLSILLSPGKESNSDIPSNGEWSG